MKKVIVSLSLLAAMVVYSAAAMFHVIPEATANEVVAEKDPKKVGGGVSMKLPKNFTQEQGELLSKAYEIAKADGHKRPEIVQAVLLQETMAGGVKKYKVANAGPNAYYGVMQLKVVAARDVLARWPSLFEKYDFQTRTDDEIKANLILNDEFNLEIGSKYLLMLQRQYGFVGRQLMNAYNRGPGGVKSVGPDYHYAVSAERKLRSIQHR